MTYIQYYIAQFKEFGLCWRLAVRTHHKAKVLATLVFLLSPLSIYTMYLYDTGKIKTGVHKVYEQRRRQTSGGARQ